MVFTKIFEEVIGKINEIINNVLNIEKYIGIKNSKDKDSLTYKLNFIYNNLYEYKLYQEDIKILYNSDSDEYYFETLNNIIELPYIKIYYRNEDSDGNETLVEEIAEIENQDIDILNNKVVIDNDIINEITFKENITYAKIIYMFKTKIILK